MDLNNLKDKVDVKSEIVASLSFNMKYQIISKYAPTTLVKNSFGYEQSLFYKKSEGQLLDLFLKNYKTSNDEANYLLSISNFFNYPAEMSLKYRYLEETTKNSINLVFKKQTLFRLNDCLELRESVRNFSGKYLAFKDLSSLLHYSFGFNKKNKHMYGSAGGLYPIKIFIYVNNVENLAKGFYQYQPYSNTLRFVNNKEIDPNSIVNLMNIDSKNYNLLLIYLYDSYVNKMKYGDESLIFSAIEVGSMLQNVQLLVPSLNLGVCDLGGYEPTKVLKALELDQYYGLYILNMSIVGGKKDV